MPVRVPADLSVQNQCKSVNAKVLAKEPKSLFTRGGDAAFGDSHFQYDRLGPTVSYSAAQRRSMLVLGGITLTHELIHWRLITSVI